MTAARNVARVCARARVVGVAFFDFIHGQTGGRPRRQAAASSASGAPGGKCAASYPTVCIPPPPPDLDCGDIPYRNFRVRWDVADPDPHRFDGDHDGVGCET